MLFLRSHFEKTCTGTADKQQQFARRRFLLSMLKNVCTCKQTLQLKKLRIL